MRRWIAVALLTFSSLVLILSCQPSLAQQERPESNRKVVNKVPPIYPALARRMNLSGTVKIGAVVAPNGGVKSTQVIGGHPLLAQSAVEAIRKWKWKAAPQETREVVGVRFQPD